MIDYPLLAYNSYRPDNSEIHLANLAHQSKKNFLIKLGEFQLISFVSTVYLTRLLGLKLDPLEC